MTWRLLLALGLSLLAAGVMPRAAASASSSVPLDRRVLTCKARLVGDVPDGTSPIVIEARLHCPPWMRASILAAGGSLAQIELTAVLEDGNDVRARAREPLAPVLLEAARAGSSTLRLTIDPTEGLGVARHPGNPKGRYGVLLGVHDPQRVLVPGLSWTPVHEPSANLASIRFEPTMLVVDIPEPSRLRSWPEILASLPSDPLLRGSVLEAQSLLVPPPDSLPGFAPMPESAPLELELDARPEASPFFVSARSGATIRLRSTPMRLVITSKAARLESLPSAPRHDARAVRGAQTGVYEVDAEGVDLVLPPGPCVMGLRHVTADRELGWIHVRAR